MAYRIEKVDVWSGNIEDRPGALAAKLAPLAETGAGLEFLLARRDAPGRGIVFLAPIKGAKVAKAAAAAGFAKAGDMAALCVTGPDKPGLGGKIAEAIANAGINLRGLCAAAVGKQCAFYLAFDTPADAAKARRALANALG